MADIPSPSGQSIERPIIEQGERGPERSVERSLEHKVEVETETSTAIQVPVAVPASPVVRPTVESAFHKEIEKVLEEDMVPLFLELTPVQKQQFRVEGERTAGKIEALLRTAGNVLSEVVRVIALWLALLPGVNRFFIEREAKIKAEKILLLKQNSS